MSQGVWLKDFVWPTARLVSQPATPADISAGVLYLPVGFASNLPTICTQREPAYDVRMVCLPG